MNFKVLNVIKWKLRCIFGKTDFWILGKIDPDTVEVDKMDMSVLNMT